jgi:hypothetical protein
VQFPLDRAPSGRRKLPKKLIYLTVGRGNELVIDAEASKIAARITAGTLPWGAAIATVD